VYKQDFIVTSIVRTQSRNLPQKEDSDSGPEPGLWGLWLWLHIPALTLGMASSNPRCQPCLQEVETLIHFLSRMDFIYLGWI